LIKSDDPEIITLAIGDGANDVSMIREAHIGVGLYGNEGMRAVQSSDFALGEFKFLWRLIMHHGRLCYLRYAELTLYFFYKNLVMTIPQLYFGFLNGFSGLTIFEEYYITSYNLFFTSWPLVIKALLEQDMNYTLQGTQIRKLYPNLYYIGNKVTIFTWSNFGLWILLGIFHSVIVLAFPMWVFQDNHVLTPAGVTVDMWTLSITTATCLFAVVTAKIALYTRWWTQYNFFFYSFLSVGVYVGYLWICEFWPGSPVYQIVKPAHDSPLFWLTILLVGSITFLSDYLIEYVRFNHFGTGSDYVRRLLDSKIGEGMTVEKPVAITEKDITDMKEFMKPIKEYYMIQDKARENYLNDLRDKNLKIAAIKTKK